jgi:hypothetical protein
VNSKEDAEAALLQTSKSSRIIILDALLIDLSYAVGALAIDLGYLHIVLTPSGCESLKNPTVCGVSSIQNLAEATTAILQSL